MFRMHGEDAVGFLEGRGQGQEMPYELLVACPWIPGGMRTARRLLCRLSLILERMSGSETEMAL